jgi:WD40 repeat protein
MFAVSNGMVKRLNLQTGTEDSEKSAHRTPIALVSISSDGKTIAWSEYVRIGAGIDPSRVQLMIANPFDDNEPRVLAEGKAMGGSSVPVQFIPDSTNVLWSFGRTILICDRNSGEIKCEYEVEHTAYHSLISPDGRVLCRLTHYKDPVGLYDLQTGKRLKYLGSDTGSPVSSTAFSPDGLRIAVAFGDPKGTYLDRVDVKICDANSGNNVVSLVGHTSFVSSITYSPDGKTLATGGRDKTFRLWDPVTGRERARIPNDSAVVYLVFSPDSRTLAVAYQDGTIKLWHSRWPNEEADGK